MQLILLAKKSFSIHYCTVYATIFCAQCIHTNTFFKLKDSLEAIFQQRLFCTYSSFVVYLCKQISCRTSSLINNSSLECHFTGRIHLQMHIYCTCFISSNSTKLTLLLSLNACNVHFILHNTSSNEELFSSIQIFEDEFCAAIVKRAQHWTYADSERLLARLWHCNRRRPAVSMLPLHFLITSLFSYYRMHRKQQRMLFWTSEPHPDLRVGPKGAYYLIPWPNLRVQVHSS